MCPAKKIWMNFFLALEARSIGAIWTFGKGQINFGIHDIQEEIFCDQPLILNKKQGGFNGCGNQNDNDTFYNKATKNVL